MTVPGHGVVMDHPLRVHFPAGVHRVSSMQAIDELARRLAELVPPGLKDARDDLGANFKAALQAGLRKLDVVTRDEFDVQRAVLLRTREKVEQLELQVAALEQQLERQR